MSESMWISARCRAFLYDFQPSTPSHVGKVDTKGASRRCLPLPAFECPNVHIDNRDYQGLQQALPIARQAKNSEEVTEEARYLMIKFRLTAKGRWGGM